MILWGENFLIFMNIEKSTVWAVSSNSSNHGNHRLYTIGRDSFNQNFRKFRSKPEWIGSVQPEKFRKNQSTFRGGPLFSVGRTRSIWLFRPILNPRTSLFGIFHVQNGGKYLLLHFYGLLTADLLVLLALSCTVMTGLLLLRKQSVCFSCWLLLKSKSRILVSLRLACSMLLVVGDERKIRASERNSFSFFSLALVLSLAPNRWEPETGYVEAGQDKTSPVLAVKVYLLGCT